MIIKFWSSINKLSPNTAKGRLLAMAKLETVVITRHYNEVRHVLLTSLCSAGLVFVNCTYVLVVHLWRQAFD